PWLAFALLGGRAGLASTVLVAFFPGWGLWAWCRRPKKYKPSLKGGGVAAAIFFACIAPWLVRNYRTFAKFIFIRDNFGAELRLGNGPGADGTLMLNQDATHDPSAMRQFEEMGELDYIAMRKAQALEYIKADYGRFAI